jgi:hypothetical protein
MLSRASVSISTYRASTLKVRSARRASHVGQLLDERGVCDSDEDPDTQPAMTQRHEP